jgi:tetratricopeptide (TPR) repeat protein
MALRHMNVFLKKNTQSAIILILAIVTLVVYWPVRNFPFINYDDDEYVYENPHVQSGLTIKNILWAFQTSSAANWHPVTWLSLMLDTELFGHDPGGYHLSNLYFHIFNTLLLFLVLLKMTNAPWRSAFVSCLFALHPLHVESVAWVSERKDLLSTFFMLLSLWTYNHYVTTRRPLAYFRTLVYFALGLMAKPMIVTFPLVLLLLDYWPINRLAPRGTNETLRSLMRRLVVEKIPFAILSAAVCVVTLFVQKAAGSMTAYPLGLRLSNAILSYIRYMVYAVWPVHLAFFYPLTSTVDLTMVAISGLALAGLSYAAIRTVRTAPWFFVGWSLYIVTLLPVIGIVRVGSHSMADRYTYVPLVGLFVIAAWGVSQFVKSNVVHRVFTGVGAAALLAVVSLLARQQVGYWQDSSALFRHALAVTKGNFVAHNNLSKMFYEQNMPDSSLFHLDEALKIFPGYPKALYNTGFILKQQGKPSEALPYLQKAVLSDSSYARALECLGETYEILGLDSPAVSCYRKAISCQAGFFAPWYRLAIALCSRGTLDSAIFCLDSALLRQPSSWETHYYLGVTYLRKHNADSSFFHMAQATRLNPVSWELSVCIGEELFRSGRVSSAIRLYSRAIRLAPDSIQPRLDRAIAFTIENKLDSAVIDYQKALRLKPDCANAHFYLGQVFNRMGSRDSATIHLREADRINPQNSEYGKKIRTLLPTLHRAESSTTARGGGLFDAAGSRENK